MLFISIKPITIMAEGRILDLETEDLNRLLDDEKLRDNPAVFLAARQAIFEEVSAENSPATLWVHHSFGPKGILSIGKSEMPTRVNFEECRRLGVPVYARNSGGWHIYNDSSSYLFINLFFRTDDDALRNLGMKSARDTTGAFRLNSYLTMDVLKEAGNINAYLHPKDPSSILIDENLIAINSALLSRAAYLEGGIRYSTEDLTTAARVINMTDGERQDLFGRNTSVLNYNPGISKEELKQKTISTYTTKRGLGSYRWTRGSLTDAEKELITRYAKDYRSLADLDETELGRIGNHEGKICIVHWITEKYGTYTPGQY